MCWQGCSVNGEVSRGCHASKKMSMGSFIHRRQHHPSSAAASIVVKTAQSHDEDASLVLKHDGERDLFCSFLYQQRVAGDGDWWHLRRNGHDGGGGGHLQ